MTEIIEENVDIECLLMCLKLLIANFRRWEEKKNSETIEMLCAYQVGRQKKSFWNTVESCLEEGKVTLRTVEIFRDLADKFWEYASSGCRHMLADSHGLSMLTVEKWHSIRDLPVEEVRGWLNWFLEEDSETRDREMARLYMAAMLIKDDLHLISKKNIREGYYVYPTTDAPIAKAVYEKKHSLDFFTRSIRTAETCPIFFSFPKHVDTLKYGGLAHHCYLPLDPRGVVLLKFPIYCNTPYIDVVRGETEELCGAQPIIGRRKISSEEKVICDCGKRIYTTGFMFRNENRIQTVCEKCYVIRLRSVEMTFSRRKLVRVLLRALSTFDDLYRDKITRSRWSRRWAPIRIIENDGDQAVLRIWFDKLGRTTLDNLINSLEGKGNERGKG